MQAPVNILAIAHKFSVMGLGMTPHCVIVSNTVTATCPKSGAAAKKEVKCKAGMMAMDVEAVCANYTTISETSMTTNVIMVNSSKKMWQGIADKAGSNVGIRSVYIALLHGIWICQLIKFLVKLSSINDALL
ncbi:hypothetical protein KIN20_020909 [Parelaphostrongylus tenuis]|uniref:Uncharacterized protein n=1 Tax=Parelaphostrongylus tenuis TaxID=148309 RepID=A0AAD5QU09_PARTN|nr:hypothetical protein KIN20_020909 [Parelaphostrongylus tenuis]